jgi:hypothetical protein
MENNKYMGKRLDDIVTNFQTTGDYEVDVDLVCKKWNHTWGIYQWEDKYRLIKYTRLGTPNTRIKVQISISQAKEIIDRLSLDGENGGFASATTWRNSDDFWAKLKAFNSKRK